MISSDEITDKYLTDIMSVYPILKASGSKEYYLCAVIKKHRRRANRKFDNTTKNDFFNKAYRYGPSANMSEFGYANFRTTDGWSGSWI